SCLPCVRSSHPLSSQKERRSRGDHAGANISLLTGQENEGIITALICLLSSSVMHFLPPHLCYDALPVCVRVCVCVCVCACVCQSFTTTGTCVLPLRHEAVYAVFLCSLFGFMLYSIRCVCVTQC